MTPSEALIVAIIETAISDALHPNPSNEPASTTRPSSHEQQDAREFLTAGSGRWARSRREYCEAIGMDPEVLRKRMLDLIRHAEDRFEAPEPTSACARAARPKPHLITELSSPKLASGQCALARVSYRDVHDRLLAVQIAGLIVSRAALHDRNIEHLPPFSSAVGQEVERAIRADADRFAQKLSNAKSRHFFLTS